MCISCRWHPVPASAPHQGPEAVCPQDGLRPQRASQQVGVVIGRRAAICVRIHLVQQMWVASQQVQSTMPMQTALCTAAVSCRGYGSTASALQLKTASCHLAGTPELTRSLRGRQRGLSRSVPDAAPVCAGTMLRAVLMFVEALLRATDQAVSFFPCSAATAAKGEEHYARHRFIMTGLRMGAAPAVGWPSD